MRRLGAEGAAALVGDRDTLAVPLAPGQPVELLRALARREAFSDLRVFAALLAEPFALFTRPGVTHLSAFLGPAERLLARTGHPVHFVPGDFRRFANIAHRLRPRVFATAAAPADAAGTLSLSLHAGATVGELHACGRDPERMLVVETSPHFPRTFGIEPDHPHALRIDEVDALVEGNARPPVLPRFSPGPVERAIADHVRRFVPSGATLQTGIGSVPGEVARRLAEGGGGDYGIHSEMFTDGLMHLHRAGLVTNRKGLYDGFSVATFALGSAELYAWLHDNREVRFLPVELVNDPSRIACNRRMVSLNGALAVDLAGQIVADTLDGRQFSGIGGHEDFVAGAASAADGRALVCLPSTARTGEGLRSRILARLPEGWVVTTPRHQVDIVVTEYGAAELSGRTVEERARALAAIAHPAFRKGLLDAVGRGEVPGLRVA